MNTSAITGDQRADVLFIHASGKHRMAKLASTLMSLGVPVSVVADIDILAEEHAFRGLYETLGGVWPEVEGSWRGLKNAIEERSPPLNAEQVKSLIDRQLEGVGGTSLFPKDRERAIKNIFRSLSTWGEVKRGGRNGIPPGQATRHFDSLIAECSSRGLWIVPVGELEGFCRSIEAGHGPALVEKVLEERSLETDDELSEARNFVRAIWDRARPR